MHVYVSYKGPSCTIRKSSAPVCRGCASGQGVTAGQLVSGNLWFRNTSLTIEVRHSLFFFHHLCFKIQMKSNLMRMI